MGLDQYAYVKTSKGVDEGDPIKFDWRKHWKLHTFMEILYTERTGLSASDLNGRELVLAPSDIDTLEEAVKGSALHLCEGGCFSGHQWQDEQAAAYRDYDLEFCEWARIEIARGAAVTYSCWW